MLRFSAFCSKSRATDRVNASRNFVVRRSSAHCSQISNFWERHISTLSNPPTSKERLLRVSNSERAAFETKLRFQYDALCNPADRSPRHPRGPNLRRPSRRPRVPQIHPRKRKHQSFRLSFIPPPPRHRFGPLGRFWHRLHPPPLAKRERQRPHPQIPPFAVPTTCAHRHYNLRKQDPVM